MYMKKSIILRVVAASMFAASAGFTQTAWAFPASHYASSSKLAKGNWVKIKISESGIYQITDADAKSWGFSNASSLHVFGKGGAPVSEVLTSDIPDDLPQVPVVRAGGKLLFYAQGPLTWGRAYKSLQFVQSYNPYSNYAYYFVTDSSDYSDIEIAKDSSTASSTPATTFIERLYHEVDAYNPGQTGRVFLGEDFTYNPTQSFTFDLKGLVDGTQVNVLTTAAIRQTSSTGSGKFSFQYNGTNLAPDNSDKYTYDRAEHLVFTPLSMYKSFTLSGTKSLNYTIKLENSNATLSLARLNSVTVNYERSLQLDNGRLAFATPATWQNNSALAIAGAGATTQVWDVTTPHNPVQMNGQLNGTTLTFATPQGSMREYIAFNPEANFNSPAGHERVANQDLHALATPDMIIITHPRYKEQAQRIADLHETTDSLRTLVLSQDEVFNEFSSGTPDAMAYRMVCKMFFDRGTDAKGHHLQYLLFMGNSSYDNRQITNEFKGIAYPALLSWQSVASQNESSSYCTDDCFAVLSDNAGSDWTSRKLDIAVGRFPVKSEAEAKVAVDKLVKYTLSPNLSPWKNQIMFVADDDESKFMSQCEDYIKTIRDNNGKELFPTRVYLDAYESVSVGASLTYPGARNDMYGRLRDGALLWCYNGHSSPNVISGNGLVRRSDYLNNMYYSNLPLMLATTCELARYDAVEESGGENMFLNPNGGAIAVISAARQAYIDQNAELGVNIYKNMFRYDDNGKTMRLGDAYKNGSNARRLSNSMRYTLLGDPAMRLATPQYRARIETINGKAVDPENMPMFKARQTLTFTGHIVDYKGNKVNDFNGSVLSTLYDCDQSVTTHGYATDKFTYQEHSNRIAMGKDSVQNGDFSIKITIPSEIVANYDNYTPALLSLYASDMTKKVDAMGSSEDFYIYGYDETIDADTNGPEIEFFGLNSENFNDGDDVNESPLVIAAISDENGINFSNAGIGHAITLTLDDKTIYSNLSSYFTPQSTTKGSAGTLNYLLSDLENGYHTLRLRVWDVFNNMSEKTIAFKVVKGLKPEIYEVYTTQNPASTETTFYVKHNRPDATLNVGIEVFDLMGRLVWKTQQGGKSDMFTSFPITWNLSDLSGTRVPRGIYLYRATVSTDGVREATKSKKLAVTSQ